MNFYFSAGSITELRTWHCFVVHFGRVYVKRCFEFEHYNLQSVVCGELVVPLDGKSTLGHCSFKYIGPSLRNALPHDIRDTCVQFSQFRSELMTLLYRAAYYP